MSDKILFRVVATLIAAQLLSSPTLAVDTMHDWVGKNNRPTDPVSEFAPDNDYGLISPTSVGGQLQSKINFHNPPRFDTEAGETIDTPFIYFADQALDVSLDFTSELHMTGTITINSPEATEPNLLFGWFNSENTAHRIGLGISNRTVAQGGAIADRLRVDFGYAATGGNRFYYVSTDGARPNTEVGSTVPNGTYPFAFNYVPAIGGAEGSMSATVGTFFRTVATFETTPWDSDFFPLDRFGLVQRSTGNTTQLGKYNVTFSNVTYTGGAVADVPIPGDFNDDDQVDGDDLTIWKNNFGTGTTLATGDADGDGDNDGADFLVWQRNLTSGSPIAGVPEPSAVFLASLGVASLWLRRRAPA